METSAKIIRVSAAISLLIISAFIYFIILKPGKQDEVIPIREELPVKKKTIKQAEPPLKKNADSVEADTSISTMQLAGSDQELIEYLSKASTRADLKKIFSTTTLLSKFVAAVDNIADGESPVKHLAFLGFKKPFRSDFKGDKRYINRLSYNRFNDATAVFISFDNDGLLSLYSQCREAIEGEYKQLGRPESTFHQTFIAAIDILLKTPVVDGEIEVVQGVVSFRYGDPKLEKLNNAQKLFLRMGPNNMRKIQKKLTEIRALLLQLG